MGRCVGAGMGLVGLLQGQDGGAEPHSPRALFAGDLGQEGKVKEPTSPTSHSYVPSVPRPLFPCVRQSVCPQRPQAGGMEQEGGWW